MPSIVKSIRSFYGSSWWDKSGNGGLYYDWLKALREPLCSILYQFLTYTLRRLVYYCSWDSCCPAGKEKIGKASQTSAEKRVLLSNLPCRT